MKTSISLRIDKRYKKGGGIYPIVLKLGHKRSSNSISLGYEVSESDWDSKNHEVKSSFKGSSSVVALNNLLTKKKAIAMKVLAQLDETEELQELSVTELKNRIQAILYPEKVKSKQIIDNDFFSFTETLIENMIKARQIGNSRVYKDCKRAFRKHCRTTTLPFDKITFKFLEQFEIEHLFKGNTKNSLSVYMRTMRAIYNKAIKNGLAEKSRYPFDDYKIKNEPTRKRAINKDAINLLIDLKQELTPKLELSKDMFAASYFLMGMNYKDLCLLKKSHIIGDRLHYKREKTHEEFNIKLRPKIQAILDKYSLGKHPNDFIFPIVKRTQIEDVYKDIEWARARQNKNLKVLAKMVGIEENLTTYVGRHSFATIAKNDSVPVAAISEMLGHKSIKTTQVYLDSLPSDVIDDYLDTIYE